MLYIVGGLSKVGKTRVAELLLSQNAVSYLSTDLIIEMLEENQVQKFNADVRTSNFEPYLESIVRLGPAYHKDICIEGNAFTPKQIQKIKSVTECEIRECFLGMSSSDIDTILKYAGPDTWLLEDKTEEYRKNYPNLLSDQSKRLEAECKHYNCTYFDMADNYSDSLNRVYQYMLNGKK